MKRTALTSAITAAVVLTGFAPVLAAPCNGGGGGGQPGPYSPFPSYPTYPQYPEQYTTPVRPPVVRTTPKLVVPVVATTTAVPQARISVISTSETSAPAGRLQLAPATNEDKAAKPETKPADTVAENEKNSADLNKSLDSLGDSKEGTSKIAHALKGLVGSWMAVSRQGDGELSTVELLLNDNGWAKLTVPGADGSPSTTTRKVEFENNEIKLTGGDADVLLGKLVEFNSRQMVLERSGGQVTFVRP